MNRPPRAAVAALATALLTLPAHAATTPPGRPAAAAVVVEVARVPAGSYYVGRATGELDYRKLTNAATPGFLVGRGQVTQGMFAAVTAWGVAHGYTFEDACGTCARDQPAAPVGGVSWRDAALFANALSEMKGLDPVYRDGAGQPVRTAVPPDPLDHGVTEPSLSGYRLPTIPEWQIALRGADKALANGTYGAPPASPNALGLTDVAGPLAEWTASAMDLGDHKVSRFVCNVAVDGLRALSQCVGHPVGWAGADVGFRLVRRGPPPQPPAVPPPPATHPTTAPPPAGAPAPARKAPPRTMPAPAVAPPARLKSAVVR